MMDERKKTNQAIADLEDQYVFLKSLQNVNLITLWKEYGLHCREVLPNCADGMANLEYLDQMGPFRAV